MNDDAVSSMTRDTRC